MKPTFKFGWLPGDNSQEQRYEYPNVFAVEKTTGPDRLVIAPSTQHIPMLFDLLDVMAEPIGVLYVLTVPRGAGAEGRYQSVNPHSKDEVKALLKRFGNFFENDGRHHLWIASMSSSDLLVFDKHNVIYAYGCTPIFEEVVVRRGLTKVETVQVPCPHTHNYNEVFDRAQVEVLRYWDWKRFPLKDSDD